MAGTSNIDTLQQRLGQRIRELRTRQGFSQKELAESCGIDADSLERIEQGEIDLNLGTLVPLALKLGMETSAILEGIG